MIPFGLILSALLGASAAMAIYTRAHHSGAWDRALKMIEDTARHSQKKVHEKKFPKPPPDDEVAQPL